MAQVDGSGTPPSRPNSYSASINWPASEKCSSSEKKLVCSELLDLRLEKLGCGVVVLPQNCPHPLAPLPAAQAEGVLLSPAIPGMAVSRLYAEGLASTF